VKLRVRHRTTYHYASAVTTSHHEARLTPRESEWQRTDRHDLTVTPLPAVRRRRTDYFGNRTVYFGMHESHRDLEVTAVSVVELTPRPAEHVESTPAWEAVAERLRTDRRRDVLDAYELSFGSSLARPSLALFAYAAESFLPGRPILEAARDLGSRIHADFAYDPTATDVSTPTDEVLEKRRGVCQDFAHVMLGCLRSHGLACRYVSGYLLTRPPAGKPRLVGADASHAWISVWVPEHGWVDFDPTNDILPNAEHVSAACGRDFSDATPLRGVILGGGAHSVEVSVDVAPLDPEP
jgi:transglutaminase-like putative cysteine protease